MKLNSKQKLFKRWRDNPEAFINEALKFKEKGFELTTQQKDCVEQIRKLVSAKVKSGSGQKLSAEEEIYSKKIGISIQSGKGTGKDAILALLITWFMTCFPNVKIPCTANSGKQLKEVLWSEIKKWLKDTPVDDWLKVQSEKIFMKLPNKDDWGKRWFATARTVNVKASADEQAETLQGFHEDYQMFVIDEASGVPDPVFKPFESTLTGLCNFIFMVFNPTRNIGYAIDSQTKYRKDWICLHWDAEKSELAEMPQFKAQIERMENKYGRDSNAFRVSVSGLPPISDSDTLIPWDWVMDAVDKDMVLEPDDPLVFGVDIGAGGDKSVIAMRRGGKLERLLFNNSKNTMEVTGWVSMNIEEYEPKATFIDVIGLGNGVYNRLRELGRRVYAVDVRNVARKPDRFKKLRDELWFNLRDQFESGIISIPNDDELISELSTIKFAEGESDGKVKIEGKQELKRRGLSSPNNADALMMTYYMPDSVFRPQKRERYSFDKKPEVELGWMAA